MTKSRLSRAKKQRNCLQLLTNQHDRAIVAEVSLDTPGAFPEAPKRRLSDAEWRNLVELLAQLHEEDLRAALVVLRLWERFGESNRRTSHY